MVSSPSTRTKVFISYSHADKEWLDQLKRHLKPLIREGHLDYWDDTHIRPSDDWKQEIQNALETAQVAVLLISANFFTSDFIDESELPPLLVAAADKGVRILPVIISASRFARHPALARFQAVNSPNWPLDQMPPAEQEASLDYLAQTIESALLERTAEGDSFKPEPPTHVVDPMSRRDFTTISAAIAAAQPGDRILVQRGYYQEGLVIDKPLEILGDSTLGDVIVEAQGKDAILFQATMGRVANLVLRQRGGGNWFGVDICQSRLDLEDCDISSNSLACVAIHNNAAPVLRGNRIHDGKQGGVFVYENGRGTLEDNDIFANAYAGVTISEGAAPVLRRNRINRNGYQAIWIYKSGGGIFESNDLTGNARGAWNISANSLNKVKHACNKGGAYDTDISGVWEGVAKFGGNPKEHWLDLYIKQSDSSIISTLVSVYLFRAYPTVVRQNVRGEIEGRNIYFSGTS